MAFQSAVNVLLAFGVAGELYAEGPTRVEPMIVNSAGAANVVGYAYTKAVATGVASVGGTIANGSVAFAGILINPKRYASAGTLANGTLAASVTVPDNANGDLLTMGEVVVAITGAANIGDQLCYNKTTGALTALVPGGTLVTGTALVPNAVITRFATATDGLVVARLTN